MERKSGRKIPGTLEEAIKELIRLVKCINSLEQDIDEIWGVKLVTSYIPGFDKSKGDINVRRGIEEIEKALNREAKSDGCLYPNEIKRLRHNGIEFTQFADAKTKTFVKAGKEPPKIVVVEE